MRPMSPIMRVTAILAICSALLSAEVATRAGASQLPSLLPQDPPPPVPVITSDQTVYPSRMEAPLSDTFTPLPSIESGMERLAMPATGVSFDGLAATDSTWANPPHLDGAVSPFHYVQVVDGHIAVFDKSNGALLDDMTFDELWQVAPGTPRNDACVTPLANPPDPPPPSFHRGSPGVLYDHLNEHWIISDVAVDNYVNGPFYFCILVSEGLNPLGTLIRYAIEVDDPWLPDSPEFAVWPDGLYVAADMYDCTSDACATSTYMGVRAWALNVSKMYFGTGLDAGSDIQYATLASTPGPVYHDLLPSNLLGLPPAAGTPNYFVAQVSTTTLGVWKFDVDWIPDPIESTFTGPTSVTIATYDAPPTVIPQKAGEGGENLDAHGERLMPHNQYRKVGATESLWLAHTVGDGGDPTNIAGLRWYQLDVTGGIVAAAPAQYGTSFGGPPADGVYRWMPSLATDAAGNMAIGYSAASTSLFPGIRYAGRTVADTAGTLGQGEDTIFAGTGVQAGADGTWGPHSSMAVDPGDDCTFWYTNMYYTAANTGTDEWTTRIASFKFPACETYSISGNAGLPSVGIRYNYGGPRTAVTDTNGNYSFLVVGGWTGTVTPVRPRYFFDPPSRQYTDLAADAVAQNYTPYPYVRFFPNNGATVCRTPFIVVELQLSNLTRTAAGAFNSATVTLRLDNNSILGLSRISVPSSGPAIWARLSYRPSAPLSLGSHTVRFTHPEASGTLIDSWTFQAADIACGVVPLLGEDDDAQTLEPPAPDTTGQPSRESQLQMFSPESTARTDDASAPPQPPAGQDFSADAPLPLSDQPAVVQETDSLYPESQPVPTLAPALFQSPFGLGPLRLPLHPGWALLYYLKAR